MKNKTFIGLTPTQEISQTKSSLTKNYYKSNVMAYFPNSYHVFYTDKKYVKQLREETWEEVDPGVFRISLVRSIQNNTLEGEQISLIWD
jgi:hypothetical protein